MHAYLEGSISWVKDLTAPLCFGAGLLNSSPFPLLVTEPGKPKLTGLSPDSLFLWRALGADFPFSVTPSRPTLDPERGRSTFVAIFCCKTCSEFPHRHLFHSSLFPRQRWSELWTPKLGGRRGGNVTIDPHVLQLWFLRVYGLFSCCVL